MAYLGFLASMLHKAIMTQVTRLFSRTSHYFALSQSQGTPTLHAVRKAADGTDKQVCTQSIVPARDCRVALLLAMTRRGRPICHCKALAPWQSLFFPHYTVEDSCTCTPALSSNFFSCTVNEHFSLRFFRCDYFFFSGFPL